MGTCEVKADAAANRLYVTLKGFSNDQQMMEHVNRVVAEVAKMRPGFVMVSDISQMKPTTPGGTQALESAMQAYKRHGIAKIVRIVGEEVIAKGQFQRVAKEAGIPIEYVSSAEEARKR
jgi:hypothetical protein